MPYPNNYSLVCRWGRLRGLFPHEDLNKETEETQEEIEMPHGHPELDGGVLQLVNLTKAVAGYID